MGGCASKNFDENLDDFTWNVKPITVDTQTWKRDSHGLFDYETNDVIKNSLKIVGSTQLFRQNDHIEQSTNKYQNSRRVAAILDVSFESHNNTITDKEEMEEEKQEDCRIDKAQNPNSLKLEDTQNLDNINKSPIAEIISKHGEYWVYNKMFYDNTEDYTENPEKQIWVSLRDFSDSASSFGYKIRDNDILKFGRARLKVVKIKLEQQLSKSSDLRQNVLEKLKQPSLLLDEPQN